MKKSKHIEEVRVIPKGNYVKLTIICAITMAIVIFCFVLYNSHQSYLNSIPVIRDSVAEITDKDVDVYFTEHDNFLMYIGVANDENCRILEEDLVNMIKIRNISNIIYLNLTDAENRASFYDTFNLKYSSVEKVNSYPAFLIISDKKVLDFVQKEDRMLNIGDIEQLLDEYEILGDFK